MNRRSSQRARTFVAAIFVMLAATGCEAGRTEIPDDGVAVTTRDGSVVISSSATDLPLAAFAIEWEGEVPACMESDGEAVPVQAERTDDGRTLLWILAVARAGEPRVYEPSPIADCGASFFAWEAAGSGGSRLVIDGVPTIEYVVGDDDSGDADAPTKPFHHVYAPDGSRLLTKGGGGNHPHHHGIFHGYRNIGYKDTTTNTWGGGRRQDHDRVLREWSGPVFGGHEVVVAWLDEEGEVFAEDKRTIRAYRRSDGHVVVDVESVLRTLNGALELGGDPHHAGLQFRAAQYVYDHAQRSSYLRPKKWADHAPDEELNDAGDFVDAEWNALRFFVDDQPYTVGYFSHPSNPPGGQMSERLYGRFGEYIPGLTVEEGRSLTLRYRFLIADGHDVDREQMEREYLAFTATM